MIIEGISRVTERFRPLIRRVRPAQATPSLRLVGFRRSEDIVVFHNYWEAVFRDDLIELPEIHDVINLYDPSRPLSDPSYVESVEFQSILSAAKKKAIEAVSAVAKVTSQEVMEQYEVHLYRRTKHYNEHPGMILYRPPGLSVLA